MPLLDHFRPPLNTLVPWTSFHSHWATALAEDLNTLPPPRYAALANLRFNIEIDVAALDRFRDEYNGSAWQPSWFPRPAVATVPFATATDELEVLIHADEGGEVRVAAAVELVSPRNKERPDARSAFVAKCHGYLQQGIGVVIVDVVTTRNANLHDELFRHLGEPVPLGGGDLYAAAYRPVSGELAVWYDVLRLGGALPELPLWVYGGFCVPLRLEPTYERVLDRLRIPTSARTTAPPA